MQDFLKRNAKAVSATIGAVLSWGIVVLTSPSAGITGGEVAGLLLALGTGWGVWQTKNAAA